MNPPVSQQQAQQRCDDILAFRRELQRLDDAGIQLPEDRLHAISQCHRQLLSDLQQQFSIDQDARGRQLSLGMRAASLVAALALAASLLFLFWQFWGLLATSSQIAILLGTPLALLLLTAVVRQRDRSGYFSKLAAMLSFAALVLNSLMLGDIFNLTPSDNILLVWASCALLLAWSCHARLLLVCGLLCLMGFIAARVGVWGSLYWLSLGEYPEHFLPAGLLLFCVPLLFPQQQYSGFAACWRLFGLLGLFLPILLLSHWGRGSHLALDRDLIEGGYQTLGFGLGAACIALGNRQGWREVSTTGLTFLLIFLYTKFFDWWWETLPKYLFFLLVGLISLLILVILQRWRRQSAGREVQP